jgi:hypothetical protein
MKVQINSLEALERLIGGDTEVEIEIRNNIVQEFTKKHLKAIANEAAMLQAKTDVANASKEVAREEANQALDKLGMFNGNNQWTRTFVLRPEIKSAITDCALAKIEETINSSVKTALSQYTDASIARRVENLVNTHIRKQISDGVKAKLDEISKQLS